MTIAQHNLCPPELIDFAAAIATGVVERINVCVAAVQAVRVDHRAVDELLLQSVLTVGWPRALVGAERWREAAGPGPVEDTEPAPGDLAEWSRRGELTCRVIYGDSYPRLLANVRLLHPALEPWLVTEGYGRTLSRAGLPLSWRELCTVAQTVVLQTPKQLHSHLLGALRSGATIDQVEFAVAAGSALLTQDERVTASELWQRVQSSWRRGT